MLRALENLPQLLGTTVRLKAVGGQRMVSSQKAWVMGGLLWAIMGKMGQGSSNVSRVNVRQEGCEEANPHIPA